jgi:hypothetical protein
MYGNADGKCPCLGNGQTVLMRTLMLLQWTDNFVGGTWIRVSRRISGQWWMILLRLRGEKGKMKVQYQIFVDTVDSKQVTVLCIIFLGTHTDTVVTDNLIIKFHRQTSKWSYHWQDTRLPCCHSVCVCVCASATLSSRCVFVCVSVSVCVNERESDMRMRESATTLMLLVGLRYESTRCVLTC